MKELFNKSVPVASPLLNPGPSFLPLYQQMNRLLFRATVSCFENQFQLTYQHFERSSTLKDVLIRVASVPTLCFVLTGT